MFRLLAAGSSTSWRRLVVGSWLPHQKRLPIIDGCTSEAAGFHGETTGRFPSVHTVSTPIRSYFVPVPKMPRLAQTLDGDKLGLQYRRTVGAAETPGASAPFHCGRLIACGKNLFSVAISSPFFFLFCQFEPFSSRNSLTLLLWFCPSLQTSSFSSLFLSLTHSLWNQTTLFSLKYL